MQSIAISASSLSKVYRIYERPEDRLVQMATLGRVRRFTEFPALHDVSLDVRRGETVGIVGRNGCGKSTLLQIICGTLQPTAGTVEVTGRISALLELGAGFNGDFTGRENVYMNGSILGFSRAEMDERFAAIADFAGIGDFIERPVKTYSSGMFVRLAFAVATSVEPDILIVDEALSVGDEAFQRKCFARIEAIKQRGGTILFVSHSAQSIVQLCDRAILLDGGEKIIEGAPRAVMKHYSRFINLPPQEQAAERAALKEMGIDGPVSTEPETGEKPDGDPAPLAATDFNDPTLLPQNTVAYDRRGAEIIDIRIEALEGGRVNNLTSGGRYRLAYEVQFDGPADQVAFGFTISTVTGLELSAIGTSRDTRLRLDTVDAGTTIAVSFEFDAALLPGVYFVTVGVSGEVDQERQFMHRILDAIMFRIQETGDNLTVGYVNVAPKPRIVKVASR